MFTAHAGKEHSAAICGYAALEIIWHTGRNRSPSAGGRSGLLGAHGGHRSFERVAGAGWLPALLPRRPLFVCASSTLSACVGGRELPSIADWHLEMLLTSESQVGKKLGGEPPNPSELLKHEPWVNFASFLLPAMLA